jgi:hypothetical protein
VSCHRIPSPTASPTNCCQAALPPRHRIALLRRSTAVKASRSASASSFLAETVCGRLASSSLAPCRVGTVRWHVHARRMARASTLPAQLTTPMAAYGQNFHPLVCPSRRLLLPRCALRRMRASLLCCRIELSHHLPPSLLAQARVAST